MKLRNNKGYVMTDISIAVIILLILVPTIMGLVYNIGVTKRATETKAEAINIATNTIEAAKGIELEAINTQSVLENIQTNIYKEKMTISENNGVITTNKSSYKVSVDVADYADSHNEAQPNVVKTITAKVEFRLGGKTQEITLRTVIK